MSSDLFVYDADGVTRTASASEVRDAACSILTHLERTAPQQHQREWPLGARAPPGHGGRRR
jgi:hypothetical protein